MIVRRGDIFFADLSPVVGSEQGGIRPVLIVQNDIGNKYSPTVICAAITSQMNKAKLPTHIALSSAVYALPKDSVVLLEQILIYVALILTVVSLVDYLMKNKDVLKDGGK